jgi:tetratricopeptide (TPR) repeat protein
MKTNLEEGLHWADLSIQNEERFDKVMIQAGLLQALDRGADAKAARDHAMEIGNATRIYFFGRQLQSQNQETQAMAAFRVVAQRFPNRWIAHLAQARVDSAAGNFASAVKNLQAAPAGGVSDQSKPALENYLKRAQSRQDFNR